MKGRDGEEDETDHLLRSPANAAALGESMAQYRRGEAEHRELIPCDELYTNPALVEQIEHNIAHPENRVSRPRRPSR